MNNSIFKNNVTPRRNSAIELLRIISMFFILIHHFAQHGGFTFLHTDTSIGRFCIDFLKMGGNFGVNVFVIISGYFLISDIKPLNIKRVLKTWGQVFFYSVLFFIIFYFTSGQSLGIKEAVFSFFPITFNQYWFASTYFVLYLLHPFLNLFLNKITKKQYQGLLLFTFVIWSVLPTFTTKSFQLSPLLEFMNLYAIAGYIKLYGFSGKIKKNNWIILWLITLLLTYGSDIIFTFIGTKIPFVSSHTTYFYSRDKIFTLIGSVCFFMIFTNIKPFYNKTVNLISSATFGVYLIHDNNFVRSFLWKTLFHNASYQNSNLLVPFSIGVSVLVFSACVIIDLLRQFTVEKWYMTFVNKYTDKILSPFRAFRNKLKTIVFGND